jgi:uncharacterized membrane protein
MRITSCVRAYSASKKLAFTALFAALCCVATVMIVIPLPNGFFNVGDVFVLLAGWFLGPLYGGVAAAVGSALADIVSGYAIYAPATAIIKGLCAVIAFALYKLYKLLVKKASLDFLPRVLSALVAEGVMVLGYFLFECALYGVAGAALAVYGNLLQGVCCLGIAVAIGSALYASPATKKFLAGLQNPKNM